MRKTKLKVSLVGPGGMRGSWTGFWEDNDVLIKTRLHLEGIARDAASKSHGVGWDVKMVTIIFPPLNPTPKTRRAKG